MKKPGFDETLALLLKEDPRYPRDAYLFLRHALNFTVKDLKKPDQGPARHITGQELLEGIRRYTLQEFGPIARTVLAQWGITRTEDFGELVFNLVNHGLLGKTDRDQKEDFANGYSFQAAFTAPFLPSSARPVKKPVTRRKKNASSKEKQNEV